MGKERSKAWVHLDLEDDGVLVDVDMTNTNQIDKFNIFMSFAKALGLSMEAIRLYSAICQFAQEEGAVESTLIDLDAIEELYGEGE